jgi:hypothetical protein
MILVRVGDDEGAEIALAFGQETNIRHHDLDIWARGIAEADAAIDRKPSAVGVVQIQIHADLTGPAERQEGKIVAG